MWKGLAWGFVAWPGVCVAWPGFASGLAWVRGLAWAWRGMGGRGFVAWPEWWLGTEWEGLGWWLGAEWRAWIHGWAWVGGLAGLGWWLGGPGLVAWRKG